MNSTGDELSCQAASVLVVGHAEGVGNDVRERAAARHSFDMTAGVEMEGLRGQRPKDGAERRRAQLGQGIAEDLAALLVKPPSRLNGIEVGQWHMDHVRPDL